MRNHYICIFKISLIKNYSMVSESQVLEILKTIIHPEKKNDLVSLGMIRNIHTDGNKISFGLVFPRSRDPFARTLKNACLHALESSLGKGMEVIIEEGDSSASMVEEAPLREVKNIVAVASGKGGVGKSTVATNLAVALAKLGHPVGLIDADVFGPSLPRMFRALEAKPVVETVGGKELIIPVEKYGVKLLSIGFFIDAEDATVWRGPMASNFLKQLMTQGDWGALDYLLVDLPPGTSDIHLTLVQEVAVTGAVIVSTPQEVALADAVKGINMFRSEKINVPVLGLVENMAWFTPAELPQNRYYIFGRDGVSRLAQQMGVRLLGQIPLVQGIREGGDEGHPAALDDQSPVGQAFMQLAKNVADSVDERNKRYSPTEKVRIIK